MKVKTHFHLFKINKLCRLRTCLKPFLHLRPTAKEHAWVHSVCLQVVSELHRHVTQSWSRWIASARSNKLYFAVERCDGSSFVRSTGDVHGRDDVQLAFGCHVMENGSCGSWPGDSVCASCGSNSGNFVYVILYPLKFVKFAKTKLKSEHLF